ncbi:MAG: hypothetical protein LBM92_06015, partial [Opitutaceae bacterium]|nr:hypothetical protein [Opitutaceae bacterium]
MNTKKNTLIAALLLSTIACGVLAWTQYQRAARLATASLSGDDRAALMRKLSDAENRVRDLEAAQSAPSEQPAAAETERPRRRGPDSPDAQRRDSRGRDAFRSMNAVLGTPEGARLMAVQQKARLDNSYARLFQKLNLPPDQLEKFKDLLIEKENISRDTMSAAREQGLDFRSNRDELRALMAQSGAELDAAIVAAIGQDNFNAYQTYQQTPFERAVVSQLDQRLSYTAAPLTAAQSDRLAALLAAAKPASTTAAPGDGGGPLTRPGWAGGAMPGGGFAPGGTQITDEVITQASAFLNAAQTEALRQLKTEQQSQRQL